ncbi:PQQ-binding-like beta-propeller repeat protein [Candidatus Woesearchaeota archaeon]|nr:PQQ-binding-like beta-propeller repeat protein [Candidatus Woesearchaeota archaeon]
MKKIILMLILICLSCLVLAEEKSTIGIVPKLSAEEMRDAPILSGGVYPPMGVPCTNFTYYAQYQDEKGREPAYIRVWHNGNWHDMALLEGNPKTGAVYTYNYVPASGKGNFYYYEASNGVGKARASIIDSPDNGPVLFSEKLDNNEIVLLDKEGKEIWSYQTGKEWVEGVAISKDSDYIAAITGFHIYLFSKADNKPLWSFCTNCNPPNPQYGGNMEGVAISQDGSHIAATLQGKLYFFSKESNNPLWSSDIESGSIGVDMSDDAKVIAVGVANAGENGDKIFIFNKEGEKLGEYKASHPEYVQTGNFYQPDVTPDGKYTAVSTGCPDRRAYLFSGKGDLIFRSEQLTYDSPVHKSTISDDGSLMAYSADHMQGKEIVFLFNNKGNKLWSFSSNEDSTARAVSISGDGNYIAAGTSAGHLYLFSKDSNKPKWKYSATAYFSQFGDIKLNLDGSLLAAGATTKKVYLFSKASNKPLWEYEANTWVTKIDFNGEHIVAGTGPREYFFEGNSVPPTEVQCKEIIQPEPLMNYLGRSMGIISTGPGNQDTESFCGNNLCESPSESYENCPQDCCPPAGCTDDDFEMDEPDDDETDVKDSFCAQFDGNRESCYAHPGCNWIQKEELCEGLGKIENEGLEEKETACGNNICETSEENYEDCQEDCMPPEEESEIPKIEPKKKGFFSAIIDFFKGLFGK